MAGESKNWPSTTGYIELSEIRYIDTHDADASSTISYLPYVEYTYTVLGSQFRSKRIGFGMDITGTRSAAEKVTARFPAGSTAIVYYNPQNPAEAVLEQKMENKAGALVIISVFLILGIFACTLSAGTILYELLYTLLD